MEYHSELLYTVYSILKGKLSSQYRLFKNFFRHASFCHFLREWISKENLYQPWGSLWVFLCLVPCHVVRAKKSDVSRLFALGISPKWIDRKGLGKCRTRQRSKVGQFRVPKYLAFKTRLRAKPFSWKKKFAWQKNHFQINGKALRLANRGFGKPRNDLLVSDVRYRQSRLRCRNWRRSDAYTSFEI